MCPDHVKRAVYFDFDDTLHPFSDSYFRALRQLQPLFLEHGRAWEEERLAQALHGTWMQPWEQYMAGVHDEDTLWWTWFASGLTAYEGTMEVALQRLAHDAFLAAMRSATLPYDDVLPTLVALRASYTLGMLSNGAAREQCARVEGSGLAQQMDALVIAGKHGLFKPDPALFAVAEKMAGVQSSQCALVGDSPRDDVAGAQAAGWKGIWLNRSERDWPDHLVAPDAEIQSLLELPSVLAALSW